MISSDNDTAAESSEPARPRSAERTWYSSLHWMHWMIIVGSLMVTLYGWYLTTEQIEEKGRLRYERSTSRFLNLVVERLQRYEDALWAGAAHVESMGGGVSVEEWKDYAERIGIVRKYPGINGMGLIHYVPAEEFEGYLAEQRRLRPDYEVHPPVENSSEIGYWPISYIQPLRGNQKAVGLDMAHETNRFRAARLTRETGRAHITGPIVLVQDAQQTPGFLFFVPFYRETESSMEFEGLVYAPFIMKKLLEGVLARENRHVRVKIFDDEQLIFSDQNNGELKTDPDPLFQSEASLPIYGRSWRFEFESDLQFRHDVSSSQPYFILLAGGLVDTLLLMLFVQITRANRDARQQAKELRQAQKQLARANDELSQFNYRASHDLVSPLKTIRGLCELVGMELASGDTDAVKDLAQRIRQQTERLEKLVKDLLDLCRVDRFDTQLAPIDCEKMVSTVFESLRAIIEEEGVRTRLSCRLTGAFYSQEVRIQQILENLVSNSVKYSHPEREEKFVEVRISELRYGWVRIEVEDNGIGIPDEAKERVFDMFYRVGNSSQYGSGLGTYLVKKHVIALGGQISLESSPQGSCFTVDLPNGKANDG
ncbi:CHASE domain-containing protein [Pelagicoccus sp. SDUM812003]|uniref:CHASE domain-containing protein n=1 Tax=Pelagicoccus sp. SDUM812003 TaxID=3041267 RepID=UPI00280C9D10|nr:CHASE domain-containing protein [Pelagicoccus sp. SDUM812003]MDQ8205074.1 CHASE domain-containing protein [Pelagicoccus sp. SDUM812003]